MTAPVALPVLFTKTLTTAPYNDYTVPGYIMVDHIASFTANTDATKTDITVNTGATTKDVVTYEGTVADLLALLSS